MSIFRVCLSGSGHGSEASSPACPGKGSRLERQYRGYFACSPGTLPRPVRVRLWSARPSRKEKALLRAYELELVGRARVGAARLCGRAAAVAVATVALSTAADARGLDMPVPKPPCAQRQDLRIKLPSQPPQVGLRGEKRVRQGGALLDEKKAPVLLGAFHSNSTGGGDAPELGHSPHEPAHVVEQPQQRLPSGEQREQLDQPRERPG